MAINERNQKANSKMQSSSSPGKPPTRAPARAAGFDVIKSTRSSMLARRKEYLARLQSRLLMLSGQMTQAGAALQAGIGAQMESLAQQAQSVSDAQDVIVKRNGASVRADAFVLAGKAVDEEKGIPLPGLQLALSYSKGASGVPLPPFKAVSDDYGNFSFTLPSEPPGAQAQQVEATLEVSNGAGKLVARQTISYQPASAKVQQLLLKVPTTPDILGERDAGQRNLALYASDQKLASDAVTSVEDTQRKVAAALKRDQATVNAMLKNLSASSAASSKDI